MSRVDKGLQVAHGRIECEAPIDPPDAFHPAPAPAHLWHTPLSLGQRDGILNHGQGGVLVTVDEPHGALGVVAALEPTDVGVLGHGPAHPLGAPPFLPFRTAPFCIPVNTPGGEGAHGLQLLKAAVAQHGGAELGHQVDELEEGGEPLKVT